MIKRWRFQFSLATLLLLTTAVSLVLAFQASHLYAKRRAIEMIIRLGGFISYDYEWTEKGEWRDATHPPGPKFLRWLLGEYYAAEPVEIQLCRDARSTPELFTDSEARQLAVLHELDWLVLTGSNITDEGIMYFKGLEKLGRLDIENTLVTDEGVAALQKARPKLRIYH